MAVTSLTDVINPSVFNPYVINRTMELSALFQSGIVANDAEFDARASGTGPVVNMPFWSDLTGESDVMTEDPITASNIGTNSDIAVIIRRVKAWGATGLSGALAGDDPMRAIGDLVAGFWARDMQKELIGVLGGALGAATTNVLDVSGDQTDAKFSVDNFIGAQAKLGDASSQLTAVVMHSAIYHELKKAENITVERDSSGKDFGVYDGRRVIVDDGCPYLTGETFATSTAYAKGDLVVQSGKVFVCTTAGTSASTSTTLSTSEETTSGTAKFVYVGVDKTYTSYLFGAGAVALGNGNPPTIKATEIHREAMTGSGEDILINRRNFILHPRGIKFKGTLASNAGPSRAELAAAANWERVFEAKQIRIVAFKHLK